MRIDHTRRAVLGAVAGVALAGCVGGDGGETGATETAADTPVPTVTDAPVTATQTEEDGGSATVRVRSHAELGDALAGPSGLRLYAFEQDSQAAGASTCSVRCTETWPPLTVDGTPTRAAKVPADLATFERGDDATQVAANGWPLYYYAGDSEPGDAAGQGSGDVWWVLDPAGDLRRPVGTTTTGGGDTY